MRGGPRSLAGQMILLIAIALFVAQAINLALLLRERRALRLEQLTGPAVVRLVDAAQHGVQDRRRGRNRVELLPANPVAAGSEREHEVEERMRSELAEAGFRAGRIVTGVRPLSEHDPILREARPRRAEWLRRNGAELTVAVEQAPTRWLVMRVPWPRDNGALVTRLVGQTLVLFVVILLPVLWIARRISRPLRDLTGAAERFRPADPGDPLPERGPRDVARLIAAFNALRLRVTGMLGEKDRMLGAIGHDLRTPLAALRVRIESVEDEADRTRMAETVAEMNRTLDDILSLARLGRPSEPVTDVDLAALVDAVVEDFRDLGDDVEFADAARLPVKLRPSLIRRAVRNLIENAVKYGERARVRIEAGPSEIAVVIADDGPGIPAHRIAEVFDPFTRLETSRNRATGGIGLGLALAQGIAGEAGGRIALANRDGGGLEARLVLPR